MVEQRSPKPSVACSSRVSPAKRSPFGLLFFAVFRESNTQRIRDGTMSVRLRLRWNDVRAIFLLIINFNLINKQKSPPWVAIFESD